MSDTCGRMATVAYPRSAGGLAMGAGAIVLWSTSSTCIFLAGKQLGIWQFLAIASLLGAALQLAGYLVMGRSLRSIAILPTKLWAAVLLGFVAYVLLYTAGILTARTDAQVMGVNLMNYLWPTLTVLFSTRLVPGQRMTLGLLISTVLALAGVLLANGRDIARPNSGISSWPYVLGGAAAVAWAAYCAFTSRWRAWAREYASAPAGFVVVGIVAVAVCLLRGEWQPMNPGAWGGILFTAAGPWAAGYMLWEMALHRAPATTLGLMGSATPVLSTICLMTLFAIAGTGHSDVGSHAVLLVSSVMIGSAVVLGVASSGARMRSMSGKGGGIAEQGVRSGQE